MDLQRMLLKCQRGQWHPDDLDWTLAPRAMAKEDEMAIVQYFTDMAGIELLAMELFREQARRAHDPVLRAIFETFVADEQRHSEVAQRLARHYDVNRYRTYTTNAALLAFEPHFRDALTFLSQEVANLYITAGELILDVALLRSIDDFVQDDMSRAAMERINRDESRHIAMDFYMAEHYAREGAAGRLPRMARSVRERARATWAFANVLYYGRPFFQDVFFAPMRRVDPTGARLREAYRRIQLLHERDVMKERPFVQFLRTIRRLWDDPRTRSLLGPVLLRLSGADPSVMGTLYGESDVERSEGLSFEQMADEAVGAKYAS